MKKINQMAVQKVEFEGNIPVWVVTDCF